MYIFIINEKAGGGKGKRIYEQLKKSELFQTLNRHCYFTSTKDDASSITERLLQKNKTIKTIIVIGGDGTLHEVINGLNRKDVPISFIPAGSGNDFARGFGIVGKPHVILQNIVEDVDKNHYFLGQYYCAKESKRSFINCIGFGFDAAVINCSNKQWLRHLLNFLRLSRLLYVFALLQAVLTFKPFTVEVELNGQRRVIERCWMVTVTNHPYFGGGMKVIPHAKIEPKIFPVLIIHSVPKWKVLLLFMTIFTGKHLSFKGVDLYGKVSDLMIQSKKKLAYQVDGELYSCKFCHVKKDVTPITMQGIKSFSKHQTSDVRKL